MASRIFPRNLTARAAYQVVGNPAVTRLESGVGNCYPGLEYDHRNLDRRFFPGLVFDFVARDSDRVPAVVQRSGIRFVGLAFSDPELRPSEDAPAARRQAAATLRARLGQLDDNDTFATGTWFVESIEQQGHRIALTEASGRPLDGMVGWRIVRGLLPDEVTITLVDRTAKTKRRQVQIKGWRRRFTDPVDGALAAVYEPGELTQSLCSPWQHDFRDCGCTYWASNHPDIVLGATPLEDPTLPTGTTADPQQADTLLSWLRSDRARATAAGAAGSYDGNRPFEMDHYEINQRWQELAFVLGNAEIDQIYRPRLVDRANPLPGGVAALQDRLHELAGIEHLVILEYLYAYYSLEDPAALDPATAKAWPNLRQELEFVRHEFLLVIVSEMRHLRWVNQILWLLERDPVLKLTGKGPALGVASTTTGADGKPRPRALRILDQETLAAFIAVEAPSGTIDGAYAQVIATLRQPQYPRSALQLAETIIADGMEHYSKFRDIAQVLRPYHQAATSATGRRAVASASPHLLALAPGDPNAAGPKAALEAYRQILDHLAKAYAAGVLGDPQDVVQARSVMLQLNQQAAALARRGIGVPFFANLG